MLAQHDATAQPLYQLPALQLESQQSLEGQSILSILYFTLVDIPVG